MSDLRARMKEAIDSAFYDSSIRPSASDVLHRLGPILDELEKPSPEIEQVYREAEAGLDDDSTDDDALEMNVGTLRRFVAAYDRRHPKGGVK